MLNQNQIAGSFNFATTLNPLTLQATPKPGSLVLIEDQWQTSQSQQIIEGQSLAGDIILFDFDNDGVFESISTADANGTFAAHLTLPEGLNILTVQASDSFGQILSTSREVLLDSTAATLTLTLTRRPRSLQTGHSPHLLQKTNTCLLSVMM